MHVLILHIVLTKLPEPIKMFTICLGWGCHCVYDGGGEGLERQSTTVTISRYRYVMESLQRNVPLGNSVLSHCRYWDRYWRITCYKFIDVFCSNFIDSTCYGFSIRVIGFMSFVYEKQAILAFLDILKSDRATNIYLYRICSFFI